ncbi:MAG: hypothetical protein M0Q91_15660 [Methanoregula sp.]|jgi:hypothetical protein|nr:hypothetical protein [Methanoregula sp.]
MDDKPAAARPPRKAYQVPISSDHISKKKTLAFLEGLVSGTSDPAVNAAYNLVAHEIDSGRLDG